jgi:hypothetical protein
VHRLDGEVERSFGEPCFGPYAVVTAAAIRRAERTITVSLNGRVDVWNKELKAPLLSFHTYEKTQREKPCIIELTDMQFRLASAAISSDLRRVVVLGTDGTAVSFKVPTTEELSSIAKRTVERILQPGEIERILQR